VPVAGVLVAAAAPLFIALSVQYFTEPLQTFAVASVFYLALRAPAMSRVTLAAALVGLATLGMAAKISSPLYCLAPGAIAASYLVRHRRPNAAQTRVQTRRREFAALTAAVCGCALTADWYVNNLSISLDHLRDAATNVNFGVRDTFTAKLSHWVGTTGLCFFTAPTLVCLALLIAVGLLNTPRKVWSDIRVAPLTRSNRTLVCLSAVLHCAVLLGVLSTAINEDPRYLIPLIAPISVVIMAVIRIIQLRPNRLMTVLIWLLGFMTVAQFGLVSLQTNDLVSLSDSISPPVPYVQAARPDVNARFELIEDAVQQTCTAGPSIAIVAVSYDYLNENTMNFFAAKERLTTNVRCRYAGLPLWGVTQGEVIQDLQRYDPEYVLSLEHPVLDMANEFSASTLRFLQASPQFESRVIDPGAGLVVFERR
jgi:hypothetical protein